MEKNQHNYSPQWNQYAYPETGARFASDADLAEIFPATSLDRSASAAGIPLCRTESAASGT